MRACIDAPITIEPGQTVLIPTGLAIHLDDPGYVIETTRAALARRR